MEPFLHEVAATVAQVMGDAYPELRTEEQRIRTVIRSEEERFGETLEKGLALLEDATSKLKQDKKTVLPGDVAFRLYDTFGFPLDLTEDILRAEKMSVDQAGFEKLMDDQRSRGRDARERHMDTKIQLTVQFHWLRSIGRRIQRLGHLR
jgi:alanyl-tRNA synthetase